MYTVSIRRTALQHKTYAEKGQSILRLSAVRVAWAFRTMSHKVVGIIADIMSPNIMAIELKRISVKPKALADA